ncbi:MAG: yecD [Gammaproteobacteria bacterium]|jgi:nicotinamidase-related amidase|nr:yecD [Gammaproteobacteria bacterium]
MQNNHNIFQHSTLILIEFQNEWLSPQGKLHHLMQDTRSFTASLENAAKILSAARERQVNIIHSGLNFSADYRELGKAKAGLRAAISKHQTFQNTTDSIIFPEPFKPKTQEFIVTGRTGASAFSGSNLDCYLRFHKIDKLYLMGYALHVCIESTLRAAHDLGYEVILIEDACAAFTQAQKTHMLSEVLPHFGTSISSNDFLNLLGK